MAPSQNVIIVPHGAPLPMAPASPRQIPVEPPSVAAARNEYRACVERNQKAWELWNSSNSVVATVQRRDELKKVGERYQWKDQARPNLERAERELATNWTSYRASGGTARTPEDVTRTTNPCREAEERVQAASREAYAPGPSPVRRSGAVLGAPEK